MVKKSLLKRVGYIATALVLMFSAVPILPGKVYAAGSCAENDTDLVQLIGDASMAEIYFCDDITLADPLVIMRDVAIDMNGKTLNGAFYIASGVNVDISNGTVYSASRNAIENNGNLTLDNMNITAAGSLIAVYGLNGTAEILGGYYKNENGASAIKRTSGVVTVSGGEFDTDPSGFLADGYSAYKPKNSTKYVVEPTLTNAIFINTPDLITIKEGEVYDVVNLNVDLSNSTTSLGYYARSNGAIATINYSGTTGLVGTGVGETSMRVHATYDTDVYKDINVKVVSPFTDFTLNEADANGVINLKEGGKSSLTVAGAETVDAVENVVVETIEIVSGSNLVKVNGTQVEAKKKVGVGTAEIKVTARYVKANGHEFTLDKNFEVRVNSALESVEVEDEEGNKYTDANGLEIDKYDTKDLKIAIKKKSYAGVNYTVESDNTDVAEVSRDGSNFTVNAKSVGIANVTVTVAPKNAVNGEGAIAVSFIVTVKPVLESISADNIAIDQGDYGQIVATSNDDLVPMYEYNEVSTGEDILDIEEDGSFRAKDGKFGTTSVEITATKDGRTVTTTIGVTVYPVLNLFTLVNDEITVYEGETAEIEIDSVVDGTIRDQVTWRYSGYDHSIIGMGGTNKITPRRDGTTTVTVTGTFVSPLGRTYTARATARVIVKSKLESIEVEDINVKVGEKADINITVDAEDISPEYTYEYSDGTIARDSRAGGVRALKAGDTELTVTATHFGKTVTATSMVHVYEMEVPEHHHYYGATGEIFDVHVGDKNENAHTIASVDKPWGMVVMGDRVMAFMPGVYTVTYTDYMANGEVVGEWTAEFTVFRVERETVVVERGETIELDGHSEWSTSSAKDETTGHHIHVNRNGKVVFTTDENTELGAHTVTMKHAFRRDVREIVKEVTVVVYEVTADSETDPEGATADALKEYIEGMFTQPTSWEEMIEKMQQVRELFGNGFEAIWSMMGVNNAVNNGEAISTRVDVTKLDIEDVDESLIEVVSDLGVDDVEYYDISVWMTNGGVEFGKLHQLNNKITVAVVEVTEPADGYTRQYIVVRMHDGEEPEILVEGEDFYIEDGILYVISDRFSTFAVAYTDTMIPAYGGVTYTVKAPETGSIHHEAGNASGSIAITLAMTITAITLAGAAIFAKRK